MWAIVMGDVVKFQLESGEWIDMPARFGIIRVLSRNSSTARHLYVVPYRDHMCELASVPDVVMKQAVDWFGEGADMFGAELDVPEGRWQSLGVVKTVLYDRPGTARNWWTGETYYGRRWHPFERSRPPVTLQQLVGAQRWRLSLPPKPVVTAHGFVWP